MNFTPSPDDQAKTDERYRLLMDEAPDAIFILNDFSTFADVNKRACEMLGYDRDELLRIPVGKVLPETICHFAEQEASGITSYDTHFLESVLKKRDGSLFHGEISCRKLTDGSFMVIVRDVTGRKLSEEKQKISEKNLRQAITSTAIIFYVIDRYGRVTLINEQAEHLLEKLWGKPVTTGTNILELIPPEREEAILASLQRVFSGESVEYEIDIHVPGFPTWILVNFAPVRDDTGNVTGAAIITKDITIRRNAEEELKRSQSRFEMISRTTNDAVWDWDLETGKLWSNDTHQLLYGLAPDDPVPSEEMWAARIHPDDRQTVVGTQQKILASDQNVFISEYRFYTEKEGYRDIYDRCYIVRDPEGKAIRMMGSMMDITDRKKIEAELRVSEEKYRSLIEQASDFIIIMETDGKLIDANTNFLNTFGFTRDELTVRNVIDLIEPENLRAVPLRISQLRIGENLLTNRRLIRKDGKIIEVEANVKMLEDGRIMAIARDIGERIKAEQAIRTSEETRRLIMNSALDAIICIDGSSTITVWTPQAERIFGWSEAEMIGRNLTETIIPPQYRERHIAGLAHYNKTGEARILTRRLEITALNRDGEEFPVELSITPFRQGEAVFFCAFIRDITERKRAEIELRNSEEQNRTLVEHAPEALVVIDMETGKFVSVSESAVKLFGFSREQLLTKGIMDVSPEYQADGRLSAESAPEKLENTIAGGKPTFEWTHIDAEGNLIPCEVWLVRLPSPDRVLIRGSVIDITERKKAELALSSERNLLRALIDNLPDYIYVKDTSFRFILNNRAFTRLVGETNEKKIIGKTSTELFDDEIGRINMREDRELMETGQEIVDREETLTTWDGKKIWLLTTKVPLKDHAGNMVGILGISKDITERKKNEQDIAESNARFQIVSKATSDMVWDWDLQANTFWLNDNYYSALGYPTVPFTDIEEWFSHIHPEDVDRVRKKMMDLLATNEETWRDEYRYAKADGTYLEFLDRAFILRDEQFVATRMIGSMVDMTPVYQAQREVAESEIQLRTILDTDPECIKLLGPDCELYDINKAGLEMLGADDLESLKGHSLLPLVSDPYKQDAANLVRNAFKGESGMMEFEMITLKGEYKWCEIRVVPFRNVAGEITNALGLTIDNTDKRKAELELKQNEEKYRTLVEGAADAIALFDARGNIIDVNDSATELLGYTREEFRNLTIIDALLKKELETNPIQFNILEKGEATIKQRKMVRKDGSVVETEVHTKKLSDGNFLAMIRDLTERIKAEEAIRELERQFTAFMDTIPALAWIVDDNGVFHYMNPYYAEAYTDGKNLTDNTYYDLFAPDLAQQYIDDNNRVFATNEVLSTVEPSIDRNNREMILQVYRFPLGFSNGRRLLGCIAIDISEITQAREKILRERDLSDSIINSLPGIFYLFDSSGKFLRWNRQFELTSGYTPGEIVSMNPLQFFRGKDIGYMEEKIYEAFEKGESYAEADFVTKDEKRIPHYFTGVMINYNDKRCLIGTGIDITDRKKAETRLVRSEAKYRTLVEQAIDAIALYDENGNIIDVNTGAVNLLGYSREELSGMSLDDVLTPEEFHSNPVRYDVLEQGESTVKQRKMRRKDGTVVETEVRSQQLPDGRFLSVIRDMSERIRTAEELEASYRAIRKLTAHLQNIREEERTHIAREIHDELGQQLTVLKMDVSWINKKITDSADNTTREKMKELLLMLDDTVKTVRRISSELRPSLLDDLGLMAAMEWQLKEFEKRSGIKTKIEAPEKELRLSNPVKTALFRIFQESLTNVARHSNAKNVTVSLTLKSNRFVLSIEDDGQGFDKGRIAEKKTLGILGMTERTTMIGGTYGITSAPGKGTKVSVSVPLNAKEPKL